MTLERSFEFNNQWLTALHAAAERVEIIIHETAEYTFASRHK
jgi:hypothetical protein